MTVETGWVSAGVVTQEANGNAIWTLFNQAPGPAGRLASLDGQAIALAADSGQNPTTSYLVVLKGFDFSAIPDHATVQTIEIRLRGYMQGPGSVWNESIVLGDTTGVGWTGSALSGGHSSTTPYVTGSTANPPDDPRTFEISPPGIKGTAIKDPNFGAKFSIYATTIDEITCFVDQAQINLIYEDGTISAQGTASGGAVSIGVGAIVNPSVGTIAVGGAASAVAQAIVLLAGMCGAEGSAAAAANATIGGIGAASAIASATAAGVEIRGAAGSAEATGAAAAITVSIRPAIGLAEAAAVATGFAIDLVPTTTPPWRTIELTERGWNQIGLTETGVQAIDLPD